MSDNSVIRVQELRKSFGSLEVLKGINLEISRGEVVTIHMTLAIKDTEQLAKLVAAFRMVRGVSKVYRSRA